eukprot:16446652-Heterocapsa_arctica.AAC.1
MGRSLQRLQLPSAEGESELHEQRVHELRSSAAARRRTASAGLGEMSKRDVKARHPQVPWRTPMGGSFITFSSGHAYRHPAPGMLIDIRLWV